MRGKILIVDHRTPTPDQDSGSASIYSYLQILARAGYDVTFAPHDLCRAEPYSSRIEKLGIRTLCRPAWSSMSAVIKSFGPKCDVLLFCRVGVASRLFDLARERAPKAKIVFHAVDMHFLRLQQQAEVMGTAAQQAQSIAELRDSELKLMRCADAAIVVSSKEYDLIRELVPEANVHLIPILREPPRSFGRPNSLAEKFVRASFRKISSWSGRSFTRLGKRRDLLFIGGFEHAPNVDAVKWFVREIWPNVLSKGFAGSFIIVGSKPPSEIQALASSRIAVRGYVKSLKPVFDRCRLSVAPLRYGAGVKGKIVTSLSYGLPVVATSIAVEGMGLRREEDILIADTPETMAAEIVRICNDDDLWRSISSNGYSAFEKTFSHSSGAPRILNLVDALHRG
jgi:glycosyltransferase involved in cell wall biosynthesis